MNINLIDMHYFCTESLGVKHECSPASGNEMGTQKKILKNFKL